LKKSSTISLSFSHTLLTKTFEGSSKVNQIYTHPGQDQMQAEVILASKGPDQKPIYTIRLRYPRIIHGEIMTHRVFSRNARSSRAVPVKTMLNEVRNTPFVPWHWGKNQKGMQASEECNEVVSLPDVAFSEKTEQLEWVVNDHTSSEAWLKAADIAIITAEAFMNSGYHKQIPNRLIEPFSWIDTLITSTEWDNFLWLRDHPDAEPHLQDLARLVKQAIDDAKVWDLKPGEWHLPYLTTQYVFPFEHEYNDGQTPHHVMLCKISAARCARISYKPFDGNASLSRELERYDSLVTADRVHASPLEHQATPDTHDDDWGWDSPHLHGNLTGYIQFRKTIPNEAKMDGVL